MKLSILSHDLILSQPSFSHLKTHSSSPPPSSSFSNFPIHSLSQRLYSIKPNKKAPTFKPISCSSDQIQKAQNTSLYSSKKVLALRRLLESRGTTHLGPACFDALSAKLIQEAGFDYCFTSGFSLSAAKLGLPDVGLISYGEMVDQGRLITQAVSIPVIGDGDNGYGNAMNVKRTVKGYIHAGFAGIILEDQVSPKACGHTQGRKVVSREEAVMRIKAAIDARKESGSDIVIVARTDSRQAISFEESLWRSRAFGDAGADVLFIDALASREEMEKFCQIFPLLPKMANMLEGGGKSPILHPIELTEMGFRLVSYPLSLIGVSIRAMQDALKGIKGGRIPPPASLPSFDEIKEILGFNAYYEEEKQYDTSPNQSDYQRGYSSSSSNIYTIQRQTPDDTEQKGQIEQEPIVEVITPDMYYAPDGSKGPLGRTPSRTLRVKITGRDGSEKLEIRIPAGFLEGISNVVPALGGVNLRALLDDARDEVGGTKLIDFNDTMGDRIQVFLE